MATHLARCLRPYTYYHADWCEMDDMAFMPAGQPYLRKGAAGGTSLDTSSSFATFFFLMILGQLMFLACLFSPRSKTSV